MNTTIAALAALTSHLWVPETAAQAPAEFEAASSKGKHFRRW
jgi:hypothetical protein